MDEDQAKLFENLREAYQKANLVAYGAPDQFQFNQNQLIQRVAEYLLIPVLKERAQCSSPSEESKNPDCGSCQ